MFARSVYLEWARRLYGRVKCDLASSGIPTASQGEIGVPSERELDDPAAWAQLPSAIARYHDVPDDEVVPALGTTHALWLAYSSLASPGDEVLLESPGYEPVSNIATALGLRVRFFERPASQGFAIDPARVRAAMTPATRVVVVTNLHNPSGVRTSDATLREVAQIADERGAALLVDEVYAPFDALVDAGGVFRGTARKLGPNVVVVSSLTKCYGLAPHRIGWMIAAPAAASRGRDAITATINMLPLSHAHVALRAFARIGPLADRARTLTEGKRERVGAWVAAQGLTWSGPREGLFGFVHLPGSTQSQGRGTDAAPTLTARVEALANERGVLVAPGEFFGVAQGFRISWSAPPAVLEEGLARLGEALPALTRT